MSSEVIYKPNPARLAAILSGYSPGRVIFILDFVSAVLRRLRDGTLSNFSWPQIAEDLGILSEVDAIIRAFDIPEEEFWRKYGRSTANIAKEIQEALHEQEDTSGPGL